MVSICVTSHKEAMTSVTTVASVWQRLGSVHPSLQIPWAQCYITFYRGNLPPLHGHTVILCYKATLPW
jgi:hypothetical protein